MVRLIVISLSPIIWTSLRPLVFKSSSLLTFFPSIHLIFFCHHHLLPTKECPRLHPQRSISSQNSVIFNTKTNQDIFLPKGPMGRLHGKSNFRNLYCLFHCTVINHIQIQNVLGPQCLTFTLSNDFLSTCSRNSTSSSGSLSMNLN